MRNINREQHRIQHVGWLRAAVLGANDGIISTSSLVLGVAAAHAAHRNILLTAVAGLVAGAMSMATGEYVSVSSQVAQQLMKHDAIGAHARDELGLSDLSKARPLQAAWASAASFSLGAALPLAVTSLTPERNLIALLVGATLLALAVLGGIAARTGGAKIIPGVVRVTFWSSLAMALSAGVGAAFGAPV